MAPSTGWREVVAPDEEGRFADYAKQFAEMQRRKSARHGKGRALHRKQVMALHGILEVFADLPPFARHGLFANPGPREAWGRLSNGGADRAPVEHGEMLLTGADALPVPSGTFARWVPEGG